jgi:hypothetical protein
MLRAELRIFKSISRHLRDEYNRHGRAREADKTVKLLNIILYRVDAIGKSLNRGKNSKAPPYHTTLVFPTLSLFK